MSSGAIVAKSKTVFGSLLKKEDYMSLIYKGSVAGVVGYLKQKPRYKAVFAEINEAGLHRAQAEALIEQNVFDSYMRICRFAAGDKKGIMSFYIKKLEAEQLIKAIIAVSSGGQERFFGNLPPYLMDKLSFDAEEAARAKTMRELLIVIEKTPYYKALYPVLSEDKPDMETAALAVNCCYIKWAFSKLQSSVKGKARDRLKSFFLRKADLDNLLLCYRLMVNFSLEPEEIEKLLIPYHYRLNINEIDEALRAPDPVSELKKLFVNKKLAVNINRKDDCPELGAGAMNYRFFRHRLALSENETEALYSLMVLFETEAMNIYRIIEGVRYGLPPEEIEKYIII